MQSFKIDSIKSAVELINIGITANQVDQSMTEAIKADVLKSDKDGKSNFTKALDKMLKETADKPEERKEITTFVRKKLQTLIKSKQTQVGILGKETAKNAKVTIKKVTLPMCDNDEDYFNLNNEPLLFNESDDLKSMRIVVERKEKPEPKTFKDELEKLMEKHGVVYEEVIVLGLMECNLVDVDGTQSDGKKGDLLIDNINYFSK